MDKAQLCIPENAPQYACSLISGLWSLDIPQNAHVLWSAFAPPQTMPPRRVPHRGVARGGRGRGRGRGRDGPPPLSPPDDDDDEPAPPPGTAPPAAKKARKPPPAEQKYVAKWTKEEVAVRSPCPKRIDSPSHVPIVCAQVAAHCWVAACERHSESSETYRISCTCTSWPEHMDACFGKKAENRGEKRGSVAMPTGAFIAAGSSASLGIIFCCWFRFLWSASQALAVRQILSSMAMVL